jgi:hypothetical protein
LVLVLEQLLEQVQGIPVLVSRLVLSQELPQEHLLVTP